MSVLGFLSVLIKPVTELVDSIHTSGEERAALVNELAKIENEVGAKVLEFESQLLQAKSAIIVAEAQGQGVLQRSWRPITMLTFLMLVVCDSFGLLTFRLAPEAWFLLQLGLGGYVIGRSAEKVAPAILERFNRKGK
jgi:hypothetical protein